MLVLNLHNYTTCEVAVYMLINYVTAAITYWHLWKQCNAPPKNNTIILSLFGIKTAMSLLLGFVIYCLLARWYKRRVRRGLQYTQSSGGGL